MSFSRLVEASRTWTWNSGSPTAAFAIPGTGKLIDVTYPTRRRLSLATSMVQTAPSGNWPVVFPVLRVVVETSGTTAGITKVFYSDPGGVLDLYAASVSVEVMNRCSTTPDLWLRSIQHAHTWPGVLFKSGLAEDVTMKLSATLFDDAYGQASSMYGQASLRYDPALGSTGETIETAWYNVTSISLSASAESKILQDVYAPTLAIYEQNQLKSAGAVVEAFGADLGALRKRTTIPSVPSFYSMAWDVSNALTADDYFCVRGYFGGASCLV